ncbi:MAG: peptidase T [Erysipelotrichaceae bacterium]|nr:peptidase T [Erysipelotrichaceae bacterium]
MRVEERLIKYAQIETTSNPESTTVPSSACQLNLAHVLAQEMAEMGLSNVRVTETGYVYGTLVGNTRKEVPSIGLIAHMDTAPDYSGKDVKPRIVKAYDGSPLYLNDTVVTTVEEFPEMKRFIGKDLIVTDGTTLLGADDKAGIAEILTLCETLLAHPEIEHGTLQIGFTPDEEIGRGADHFDVAGFGADFAYTIDGGCINGVTDETFNAAEAKVVVKGVAVHPGSAKNVMINSLNVAQEFHHLLPATERPEHTEGREGFYHLDSMSGSCEETKMSYILRNHDLALLQDMKKQMELNAQLINERYEREVVEVKLRDQYLNMKEKLNEVPYVCELAEKAVYKAGFDVVREPARGGTDGSTLTFMGLPCPNLGTGSANCHGRHEVACIQEMEMMVKILLNLVQEAVSV